MKRSSLLLACLLAAGCDSSGQPNAPRVVILGIDGMDFGLTSELMAKGRMPNFSRLARTGMYGPLRTTQPPQSPVAWSTFTTGLDASEHGIFDFVHRDPETMVPYLSTTRTEPSTKAISVGRWRLPLTSPRVYLLREGRPFWELVQSRGIATTVIRMPANFPPSGTAGRELSGMGTPDMLGTYGIFSFYTSDSTSFSGGGVDGGVVYYVDASRGVVEGSLEGPPQPYLTEQPAMRASFVVYVDHAREFVKIAVGKEERILRVGEWSDWVPVSFAMTPWRSIHGQSRFYLKQLAPHFQLYVSPVNIDPMAPAITISTPKTYASELARASGRFYTQGMPEDTKALKAGILSLPEFLHQARLAQSESLQQLRFLLEQFKSGLLFHYFGNVDQVSHVLWGMRSEEKTSADSAVSEYGRVIDDLYIEMDRIVGETLGRLEPQDLLVVMSDHGFASWRRAFSLNTWLKEQGYLTKATRNSRSLLNEIDLSRTRAYGLGLNALYINVRGREAFGTVEPSAREALVDEIRDKLMHTIDPETGKPVVSQTFRPHGGNVAAQPHGDIMPDLILGYAKGTRVSDGSALGALSETVFAENRTMWTGDHCMDAETVPGIVLTNRMLKGSVRSLESLAGTILAELGIGQFPTR